MAILSTFALTLYTKATSELQMLGCINGHGFFKLYNPTKYNKTQASYFRLICLCGRHFLNIIFLDDCYLPCLYIQDILYRINSAQS